MLKAMDRRWFCGLGVGLPLLLGSGSAAAAGSAALGVGLTTWVGVLAALWAVFAAPSLAVGASTLAAAAFAVAMLGSAVWAWRHRLARLFRAPMQSRPFVTTQQQLSLPAGLDKKEVLDAVRSRFLHLQAAWDAGDVAVLRSLTMPDMLEELLPVLGARATGPSRTDVISLHAELIGLEELNAAYLASVEFSGLIRESAEAGTVPFRELWMLAGTKDGTPSWRLARQQALL